jgi:hypothetical protein
MEITDMATVKTMALMYNLSGNGAPTGSTAALVGEVYMDEATGLTYKCTGVNLGVYSWAADTSKDHLILMGIERAEQDYIRIRGIPFETHGDGSLYPPGAYFTAAEMVCYLVGLGDYEGRGKQSESFGGRSVTFDEKLIGYPASIAGGITRFHGVK